MVVLKTSQSPLKEACPHDDANTVERTVVTLLFRVSKAVLDAIGAVHPRSWPALPGRLSIEARGRSWQDLPTAWQQPGILGQPGSFGDDWKWCDQ